MTTSRSFRTMRTVGLPAVVVALLALLAWPAGAATDPRLADQWALARISAPAAWASATGAGVKIGIVDTGVDLLHEDLAGRIVAHASCVGSDGDAAKCGGSGQDENGHGTHVAGIAAAIRGNGKGIAGVAPSAQLVVAKVLNGRGSGTVEDINAGIKWVVDQGARVVNLSLGDPLFIRTALLGSDLSAGIRYAWSKGAVPVLASGNSNLLGLGLLGSSQYGRVPAIVVGATDRNDRVARYSSPLGNANWAILAPGGAGGRDEAQNVLSTYWVEGERNQYKALAGTSMAAPHVTGAIALLLSRGMTAQEAVARVLNGADRVSCGSGSPTCRGRLNVARALAGVAGGAPAPSPRSEGLLDGISSLLPI